MMTQTGERHGDWFQTFTGAMFFIEDPRASEIAFDDIAHPLAYQCRFNGHTKEFYSVAQHAVLVARCLSEQFGETNVKWLRTALLHDAAEAYTGDMVRPLKRGNRHFRVVELRLEEVLAERFDLIFPLPQLIKRADNALLHAERNLLMRDPPAPWDGAECEDPYAGLDACWSPEIAEQLFRRAAVEYGVV